MALELAASIIGILAAPGKVAETLGPVVSAFVDAPKHANTILIEVRYSRTILLGLQTLLDELSAVPQRRQQLIQADQLIAALTDGVLLFSELDSLVDTLGDPTDTLLSRARWARKDGELESIVARLLGFKTSIALMLGILRCESDLVAQYDRKLLLENTASILKNNIELSQRLAHLEIQLDATRSLTTRRTVSVASTNPSQQIPGITESADVTQRASVLPNDAARVFQFEPVLKASRVYRRAKRDTADFSFCSSIPLSHAWTTLSDLSLCDISIISVIALPVQRTDIANADRYEFKNWPLNIEEDGISQRPESRGSMSTLKQSSLLGAVTPETLPWIEESPSAPAFTYSRSERLRVSVIGAPEIDVNLLVGQYTSPPCEPRDPQNLFNHYEKSISIDDFDVKLDVAAVVPSADAFDILASHFRAHQIFMLVYSSTSRESFDKVRHLIWQVQRSNDSFNGSPMMVVSIHSDDAGERAVSGVEQELLCERYNITFREVSKICPEVIDDVFSQLVRQMWDFELQNYHLPPLLRSQLYPPLPPLPLEQAKTESKNVASIPRRLRFLRKMTENDRMYMFGQPLGSIQEVVDSTYTSTQQPGLFDGMHNNS